MIADRYLMVWGTFGVNMTIDKTRKLMTGIAVLIHHFLSDYFKIITLSILSLC